MLCRIVRCMVTVVVNFLYTYKVVLLTVFVKVMSKKFILLSSTYLHQYLIFWAYLLLGLTMCAYSMLWMNISARILNSIQTMGDFQVESKICCQADAVLFCDDTGEEFIYILLWCLFSFNVFWKNFKQFLVWGYLCIKFLCQEMLELNSGGMLLFYMYYFAL